MKFPRTALFIAITAVLSGNAIAEQKQELAVTRVKSEGSAEMTANETTLDAVTLSRESITSIEDTVRYIPGVQVNDTGNRFGDDGFNMRGLGGDAVAVTIDGVAQGETLNPSSFAAYGMFGSSRGQVELEHVKTVTILKGPGSVTTGSGALAGSVSYVTHDAADFLPLSGDATGGQVKTGFDSRSDEWLIHGTVANRSGKFESLLQYTRRDSHETKAHDNGADIAGSARGQADPMDNATDAVLLKFGYNLSDDVQFGVLLDKSDRSTDGIPLSREPAEGATSNYFNFSSYDKNNRERYGLFYQQQNIDNLLFDSVDIQANYQELYTSGLTAFLYNSVGSVILRQEDRNFSQDSISINADFSKSLAGAVSQEVVYGVSYQQVSTENVMYDRRYDGENTAAAAIDGYPILDQGFVPTSDKTVFSVYAADTLSLTDAIKLYLGGRYDSTEYEPEISDSFSDPTGQSVADADFSAFVGEVALSYTLANGHELQAKVSQGYKAPTLQELYFGTNSGETITDVNTGVVYQDLDEAANPELDAEQSTNYEVSYQANFDRGSLTITAFQTRYNDRIQSETFSTSYDTDVTTESCSAWTGECTTSVSTEDIYTQAQNSGEVRVRGIELTGFTMLTRNISAQLAYSTMEGEYESEYTPADENSLDFYDKGDDLETLAPDSASLSVGYLSDTRDWGAKLHVIYSAGMDDKSAQQSFSSLNNGSGPYFYPASATTFDLTAFYSVTENLRLTAALYNLTDKEHYRWGVVSNLRPGNGGFFSGISRNGYQRFSEPGRSGSLYVTYVF